MAVRSPPVQPSTEARKRSTAMTTIHRIATSTVAALALVAAYLLTPSAASASRQPLGPDNPFGTATNRLGRYDNNCDHGLAVVDVRPRRGRQHCLRPLSLGPGREAAPSQACVTAG